MRNGWVGWLAILGAVLAWDVPALRLGWQTDSEWVAQCFDEHPWRTLAVIVLMSLHLIRWPRWFRRFDPIHNLAVLVSRL